jgi:hypothetical protein
LRSPASQHLSTAGFAICRSEWTHPDKPDEYNTRMPADLTAARGEIDVSLAIEAALAD